MAGPLVIAEAGVNHNGDLGLALEMVAAAADAGATSCLTDIDRSEHLNHSVSAIRKMCKINELDVFRAAKLRYSTLCQGLLKTLGRRITINRVWQRQT